MNRKLSNGKNNGNTNLESNIFEQIDLEIEKQSEFLKLKDGEVRVLQFDPKQIKLVDSDFNGNVTKRVEYKVIDPDKPAIGEKRFQMALNNARQINKYLERGRKLLEIERMGSDIKTRYNISAATR